MRCPRIKAGLKNALHQTILWVLMLVSLGVASLLIVGCSVSPRVGNGVLISTAGSYAPEGKAWSVSVAADGQYELLHASGLKERHEWHPKAGWFLFIEDGKHLWTFDGVSQLHVFVWTSDGSIGRYDMASYRGEVPQPVLSALPAEIREQVKARSNRKS